MLDADFNDFDELRGGETSVSKLKFILRCETKEDGMFRAI